MPKKSLEPIDLTVENLPKMTVVMLKNILESKDLPIAGKKAELVDRLTAYLQKSMLDVIIIASNDCQGPPKSPAKGDSGDQPKSPSKTPASPAKNGIFIC
jgi:SAP domain